jgi:hypothetical protein
MPMINVLKPFVFTHQPNNRRMPTEQRFEIGMHDVSEEFMNHEWIRDTLAEGRIESPAGLRLRLEAEAKSKAQTAKDAQAATDAANAAFARLKAAEPGAKGTAEEITKELDTPIPELKRQQEAKRAVEIEKPLSTKK